MTFKLPSPQAIKNWASTTASNVANTVSNTMNTAVSYIPPGVQESLLAAGRAVSPDLQAAYNAGTASAQQNQRLVNQSELATAQTAQAAINAGYEASPEQQKQITQTLQNYYNVQGTATNPPGIGGGPSINPQDYPTQQLAQEIPGVDPFTFNWVAETQKAYDSLADFYNKLLSFAGGRLDLAKRMLEYTYQSGMRELTSEYEFNMGELMREQAVEVPKLITALNRRGVYDSGFGQEDVRRQGEGYTAREQILTSEKERKAEDLLKDREFGLEEQTQTYEERKFDLERERRKESEEMAANQRAIKGDIYQSQLEKQAQEEARRTQNVAAQATGQIAGGSTSAPSTTSADSDTAFRNFMQTAGKQAELDRATFGSTQQGAEYYALKKKYGY